MISKILTIAGSDSGGGAGIQADLKTFSALRTYGLSVITAVTAQNTMGVMGIETLTPSIVQKQLEAVFTDIPIHAVKIGMVSDKNVIEVIAQSLRKYQPNIVIVDPVMVSTTGSLLLEETSISALKQFLFPLATLITPNIHEAEVLLGTKIRSLSDMHFASQQLQMLINGKALVKGGHLPNDGQITDVLSTGESFTSEWIPTRHTHGTGCSLSAAIAALMGRGYPLSKAIQCAKEYVTEGLRAAFPVGKGAGPIHHFHANWNLD